MRSQMIRRTLLGLALLAACSLATAHKALAQNESATAPTQQSAASRIDEATGLEVQLYLLVATKSAGADEEKLPSSLDAVVKQLRSTFTFKSYRLGATLLNRVSNGGRLELRWAGGQLLPSSAATTATPGFNEFRVGPVRLMQDKQGRTIVQMQEFKFGARIPILIPAVASTGSVPVVQYENTGITTDISVLEGEPTVVGTLNVGPSGDAIIIVVSAKRPSNK